KKPPDYVLRALSEKYGLDYLTIPADQRAAMPLKTRADYFFKAYAFYLKHSLHGDFGPAINYPNFSVMEVIGSSLPVPAGLGSLLLVLALWGGVIAGTLGAIRKGRLTDFFLAITTLLGVSLPTFVVGALLMMLLVVYIPLLPAAGWGSG